MKIYTKAGDKGETAYLGKGKLLKNHPRIEAYGTIDELNSLIGICLQYVSNENKEILYLIQNQLFDIGTELASEKVDERITQSHIQNLEKNIDTREEKIPTLKAFILPGGSQAATWLHLARTVTRRAERRIVEFKHNSEVNENVLIYVNRLSDLLFVMARYENQLQSIPDVEWISS